MADNIVRDDNVQHGIDDNPVNDAEKGAKLGGLGGAAVGAVAGSAAGPLGTVVGAVVGGVAGAGASGAAVGAVDKVDNDNTITGVGDGVTTKNP
jgi:outer membrane lipoprotein SlyB